MKQKDDDVLKIFTDGACNVINKIGGWASIIIEGENEKIITGSADKTTNNRMEMIAVIKALNQFNERRRINIYSDSNLIIDSINSNKINKWQNREWKTNSGNDRKNKDLWLSLIKLIEKHDIKWIKVKAHSKIHYNNLANKLARKSMRNRIFLEE